MVMVISSQCPASASSIALSTTSKTMWCSPVPSEVSPIYIPGRLRTASSPLSTLILSESYWSVLVCSGFPASLIFSVSDTHRHDDILEVVAPWNGDERARIRITEPAVDLLHLDVVQHVEQVAHVEPDVQRIPFIPDIELFLCFLLLRVAADDLERSRRKHPAHPAELVAGGDGGALERLEQLD